MIPQDTGGEVWEEHRTWGETSGFYSMLQCCVTLDKSAHLSRPCFLICKMDLIIYISPRDTVGFNEIVP